MRCWQVGSTLKRRRIVPGFLPPQKRVSDWILWIWVYISLWLYLNLKKFEENSKKLGFFIEWSLITLKYWIKIKIFNGFDHRFNANPWDLWIRVKIAQLLSRPPIRLFENRVILHQKKAKIMNSEKRRKNSPTCSAYLQQMFSLQISTPIIRFLDFLEAISSKFFFAFLKSRKQTSHCKTKKYNSKKYYFLAFFLKRCSTIASSNFIQFFFG